MTELSYILSSPRILEILENACKGVERGELKEVLKVSKSHFAQLLKRASDLKLIEKRGDWIFTLPRGKFVLRIVDVVNDYFRFLNVFGDYLDVYILDDIPEWLITRFYELAGIEIVERQEDVFSPHEEFFKNLLNSKEICGYTTVFFKEYVDFFLRLAEEGRKIEVIVNRDVFSRISKEFAEEFKKGIKRENVGFYVSREDFRFSFIVTDIFFSISFYLKNGFFDYKRDFVCKGENARRWGIDLFNYVRENSDRIR
jgi:predicted transcriptional regulator